MSYELPNYLRTYRKRAGLTQNEMALLLGCRNGAKVSRYEHYSRLPNLQTVIAYQIIFRTSTQELFEGIYEDVERATLKRVRAAVKKLSKKALDLRTIRKLEILRSLLIEEK